MYHDQGLTPFKALSFGGGINFTVGLPIVRTSPDHGTGYEIAGKNVADPRSFRQALYLAIDAYKMRKSYREMTLNPLKETDLKDFEKKQAYKSRRKNLQEEKNVEKLASDVSNEALVKQNNNDKPPE